MVYLMDDRQMEWVLEVRTARGGCKGRLRLSAQGRSAVMRNRGFVSQGTGEGCSAREMRAQIYVSEKLLNRTCAGSGHKKLISQGSSLLQQSRER
jgi:hypothetical protein